MEWRRPLDAAGGASLRGRIIRPLVFFKRQRLLSVFAFCFPRVSSILGKSRVVVCITILTCTGVAQNSSHASAELSTRIRQLAIDQNWSEIVHQLDAVTEKNADLNYSHGS